MGSYIYFVSGTLVRREHEDCLMDILGGDNTAYFYSHTHSQFYFQSLCISFAKLKLYFIVV